MNFTETGLELAVRAIGGEDVEVSGPNKVDGGVKQSFGLMFTSHGTCKRMAICGPSGCESAMLRNLLKWASEAA